MAEQKNNRRTDVQILDDKRSELSEGLVKHRQYLDVVPRDKQENFKKNFLELVTQDYLLSIIEVKEIIRFAANITKLGLDISPSAKEVYIIPFDTKVNGQKVMLPQSIIPFTGMQQLAYQKGFFLEIDAVYKFDDNSCEASSKLSRIQQSQLRTADEKWVEAHFIGYDVKLTDLKEELPTQVKFVDISYMKEATKTVKDNRWKLQTWSHKAVRRAYKEFMIPRERAIETLEKIEQLNDSVLEDAEVISSIKLTQEIEEAIKQFGLSLSKQNGIATIIGQAFGKDKILKELGFVFNNGKWSMDYEDVKALAPSVAAPKPSPAKELMQYLTNNGLTKEEVGSFVKDVLGLSSSDTDGIQALLADKNVLDLKIQEFLAADSDEIPEDVF
ncbi:MAG: recombinase RecT [Sulfurimonas sp.]|jgi:hypothetical protein